MKTCYAIRKNLHNNQILTLYSRKYMNLVNPIVRRKRFTLNSITLLIIMLTSLHKYITSMVRILVYLSYIKLFEQTSTYRQERGNEKNCGISIKKD